MHGRELSPFGIFSEDTTQTTMKKAEQLLLQKLISKLDKEGADLPHPPTKE